MSELEHFERSIKKDIDAFLNPQDKRSKPKPAVSIKTGFLVKLAVRRKRLEADILLEHESSSISKVEAQLEAERAARDAGYPVLGYLVSIEPL
ncbi:hypothetical protein SAMN05661010_02168 [Modicisalibacter muralis]|uniref:Uncharacterized protein n=1 Tax=Modicisalibacter muralis TaxID=119000 RepID=A0A1G9LN06_9GAMM|nr:hypothetical protein [Halomonas muralis]SDL63330.1 hypothetical protein SAMN05661010_02168 [Halomonas muralis]